MPTEFEVVEPPDIDTDSHEWEWLKKPAEVKWNDISQLVTDLDCRRDICHVVVSKAFDQLSTIRTMSRDGVPLYPRPDLARLDLELSAYPGVHMCDQVRGIINVPFEVTDITLSDGEGSADIPDLSVMLRLSSTDGGRVHSAFAVPSDHDVLEAIACHANDEMPDIDEEHLSGRHWHPHVSEYAQVCLGSGQAGHREGDGLYQINAALIRGDLHGAIELLTQLLRTYNPASPYRRLHMWYREPCPNCGSCETQVVDIDGDTGCHSCLTALDRGRWVNTETTEIACCRSCSSTVLATEAASFPLWEVYYDDERSAYLRRESDQRIFSCWMASCLDYAQNRAQLIVLDYLTVEEFDNLNSENNEETHDEEPERPVAFELVPDDDTVCAQQAEVDEGPGED